MRSLSVLAMLPFLASCKCTPDRPGAASVVRARAAAESELDDELPDPDAGDLPHIKERGELRVLVARPAELALGRRPSPEGRERDLVLQLAERIGLRVHFIEVAARDRLLPYLLAGRADMVAAQLTVTEGRAKQVTFTRPVDRVSEHLVCKRGDTKAPRTLADLNGRTVHVRASSSFAETLAKLQAGSVPDLHVVYVREDLDSDTLAYDVGRGARPLTVLDSHMLSAIQAYNEDVESCLVLAQGREIAWAMRPSTPQLKAAADAFLVEKALTGHTEAPFTGDLTGIRERGVLRVLTRNNPVTYFVYRGEQLGFEYELAKSLAQHLGVRLEMVVPPSRDELLPWLLQGKGDLIAASLSVTPERLRKVAFSAPYLYVRELVVQRAGRPRLGSLQALRGKSILVRRSSSYYESLQALAARYGPFNIQLAPEDLETEQLVAMVANGEAEYTVADSHLLAVELTYAVEVEPALLLAEGEQERISTDELASVRLDASSLGATSLAFAVRPSSKELKAAVDAFLAQYYRSLDYNVAIKRYFQDARAIRRAKEERMGVSGRLSPYDDLIKKYSLRYGFDWRLMAAQAYQESHFDPSAKSWVGAIGLFQLMPATGRELGFDSLGEPEANVHAAIKYMSRLVGQFDNSLAFKDRVRFALAAFNAGRGHVLDARRLAQAKGWDPDRWFHNVEQAMLLLEQSAYYSKTRYGYCRGSEPVSYVSRIQNRYDNYIKAVGE